METILAQFRTTPYYGQIVIQNPGTHDLPDWATGEERCIFSDHAIIVATQPDSLGDVEIDVRKGSRSENSGLLVFDGAIRISGTSIEVGTIVGGDLRTIQLGRDGLVPLKVFVSGVEDAPSGVSVIVDP